MTSLKVSKGKVGCRDAVRGGLLGCECALFFSLSWEIHEVIDSVETVHLRDEWAHGFICALEVFLPPSSVDTELREEAGDIGQKLHRCISRLTDEPRVIFSQG